MIPNWKLCLETEVKKQVNATTKAEKRSEVQTYAESKIAEEMKIVVTEVLRSKRSN